MNIYCQCGCGRKVSLGKKFIVGHYWEGKHLSKAHKEKIRKATLKQMECQETRDRIRKTLQKFYSVRKPTNPMLGKHMSKKAKEKISEAQKTFWQNSEFVAKRFKAYRIKPNNAELRLNKIIQKCLPDEFALNVLGDKMTLGRKIPDFVNINGKKQLIELYGDFWHKGDNPQERIDLFKTLGWDTLIIWEHELKDLEQVEQKIFNFNQI